MTDILHPPCPAPAELRVFDVIVVGGSFAGLSAAMQLARARRRVCVVDAGQPRNRFAPHMHNVLGHDGRPPAKLTTLGRAEAVRYGVEFRAGVVASVRDAGATVELALAHPEVGGQFREYLKTLAL